MAEPIEMRSEGLTHVGLRNHVLCGVKNPQKGQFVGLSGPLKSIVSHCCVVGCKKSIAAQRRYCTGSVKLPSRLD